jgi:hypothetical protein
MRMLFALIHDRGIDVEKWKTYIKQNMNIPHFNELSIEDLRTLYRLYKNMDNNQIEEVKRKIEEQLKTEGK